MAITFDDITATTRLAGVVADGGVTVIAATANMEPYPHQIDAVYDRFRAIRLQPVTGNASVVHRKAGLAAA